MLLTGEAAYVNPLSIDPDIARGLLVQELTTFCKETRQFWRPIFDRIKQEQKFAAGKQWPSNYICSTEYLEPYIGDVVQQMINRKTATLYAKNPTPEANRRETMQFTVWDGSQQSYDGAKATVATAMALKQQAMQIAATGADVPPPPPEAEQQVASAQAIVKDYDDGMLRNALYDKIAETATKLLKREWDLQTPDLIVSMKQMVTRVLTSRVGYIKVLYRREDESPNTVEATVNTLADDLQAMQRAIMRMQEPDFDPKSAEAEKFKLLAQSTQDASNPAVNLPQDEGVIYDFLGATSVLIDKNCKSLREFVGARRIAHEVLMTVDECERKYNINLNGSGCAYYTDNGESDPRAKDVKVKQDGYGPKLRQKVCVWEIQDKDTGCVYTICDGVKDFIKEPEPNEPLLKRFWSIVPVVFNCQEVEVNEPELDATIYPRSDIRLGMSQQIDLNTAGEGLREHRTANRPYWIGIKAKFSSNAGENDLMKMNSPRPAHTVLMVDSLNPGEKIGDSIMAGPMMPIDPKMYDPALSMQAFLQATGMQASDLGQQEPNEKATGQQIAAQQKATTDSSNIDDLDFALSTVAQMTWEMMIQEMPKSVVQKLIGPGAVWPDIPQERVKTMNEIYLSIEAGSSGRPNQMQELENFKIIAPQLGEFMQANGYDMLPLLKEGVRRLGDKLDIDDFLKKLPPAPQAPKDNVSESVSIKLDQLSPEERAQALANANIKAGGVVPKPTPTPAPKATPKN